MSTNDSTLGREITLRSSKSSLRHSSCGSVASLPPIVEVPEDVETRNPYVKPGLRGLLSSRYCLACAAFAALGGFTFGYDQGVMSVILVMNQFLAKYPQVEHGRWKGFVTAILQLGGLFGALSAGWMADKFSIKRSMIIAVFIFSVGAALQAASVDFRMLLVGRFVGGLGMGILTTVVPVYISEISPPEIRGSLLVLEEIAIVTGIIVAFWITFGTRYITGEFSWRLPFLLQIVPAIILGLGVTKVPYSPRWLASKFQNTQALFVLSQLRQLSSENCKVQNEWMEIRVEVVFLRELEQFRHYKLQEGTFWNRFNLELALWFDCFRSTCWNRTMVGIGIMFFQQFVGVDALIYYAPTFFQRQGLNYNMQLIMSGVLNTVQLLGVLSSLWTTDRFGRKRLLIYGSTVMFICLITIIGLSTRFSSHWQIHHEAGWVSVGLLFVYMLAFGASWGPVSWIIPSEIFPSSLRAKGVALSTCSNWLNSFIVGLVTPLLLQKSEWGTYTFFAIFCFISGLWVSHFVPETRDMTLEDMDRLFGDTPDFWSDEERRKEIRKSLATGYVSPEPFVGEGGRLSNGFRGVEV